jgi:hypothetical protein
MNLPGLDIKVEREPVYATTVHQSNSGKEVRVSWQTAPRVRYTLTFSFLFTETDAPAPNQAYTQTEIIQKFFDDHRGQWDSFLFDDPMTGTQVRVRFATDTLTWERVADGMWAIKKLQLITVV